MILICVPYLNVCDDEYHYVLICRVFKHSGTMYLKL